MPLQHLFLEDVAVSQCTSRIFLDYNVCAVHDSNLCCVSVSETFSLFPFAAPSGGIPAVPSRLGAMSASDRDALMRKAKEAGMPRFNPALGPQTGLMAMRMGAGGAAEGAVPAMQTATTSGEHGLSSCVASASSSITIPISSITIMLSIIVMVTNDIIMCTIIVIVISIIIMLTVIILVGIADTLTSSLWLVINTIQISSEGLLTSTHSQYDAIRDGTALVFLANMLQLPCLLSMHVHQVLVCDLMVPKKPLS